MRKTREILRLRWGRKLSLRAVAKSVGVSPSTVLDCTGRAEVARLVWPLPEDLDDGALESLLYPPPRHSHQARFVPDWATIHREMKRKHVTLQLLWQEYKRGHPDDGYTQVDERIPEHWPRDPVIHDLLAELDWRT